MTFVEHLTELRSRLIRSFVALIVSAVVCFCFSTQIYEYLAEPLQPLKQADWVVDDSPAKWVTLSPIEWIQIKFKLAGYGGLVLALPYLLYQVCAFIFPGLKPNEKRAARVLIFGCGILAVFGVLVAYFCTLPFVLPYLLQMTPEGVETQLRMSETVAIILKILVGFAIAFQFPMAVLILVFLGLLSPKTLRKYRRIAIVVIAVLSALLTPPDPYTMMMMGAPLVVLYELSIWTSYLLVWRQRRKTTE